MSRALLGLGEGGFEGVAGGVPAAEGRVCKGRARRGRPAHESPATVEVVRAPNSRRRSGWLVHAMQTHSLHCQRAGHSNAHRGSEGCWGAVRRQHKPAHMCTA